MKRYLRLRCPEWLVCTLTAAGLTANVLNGYDLKDPLSDSLPALTGVTAGIMAVIFLVCYSRKTLKFGVLISVGAATAAMAVLHLQKPYLTEQKSSLQIFWILTVLIGVGVYWISRTRAGAMVLFAVGNLVMAAVVFLKFGVDWPGYAFFMVGGTADQIGRASCRERV